MLIAEQKKENVSAQASRIRHLRDLLGLTRPEIEARYGIKQTTLSKWELGINKISPSQISRLVQIAQENSITCTKEWLLYGKGEEARTLGSHLENPSSITDLKEYKNLLLLKEIAAFKNIYKESEVLLVTDESMVPQFTPGDYVGGVRIPIDKLRSHLDSPFIVKTRDSRIRLRRITISMGEIILYGINMRSQGSPICEFRPEIEMIAPVFWHRMGNF